MPRQYTGNIHTGTRRIRRPNGDIYVYERVTQYDRKTQKTKTLKNTLLGILDPETGEIRPTRKKSDKKIRSDRRMQTHRHDGHPGLGCRTNRH